MSDGERIVEDLEWDLSGQQKRVAELEKAEQELRSENLRLRAVVHALTHPLSAKAVFVETVWTDADEKGSRTLVGITVCAPQLDEKKVLLALVEEMQDLFATMGVHVDGELVESGSHLSGKTR